MRTGQVCGPKGKSGQLRSFWLQLPGVVPFPETWKARGERVWAWVVVTVTVIFLWAVANHCTFPGLKQYTCILLQFWGSGV